MKRTIVCASVAVSIVLLYAACAFPNLPQVTAPAAAAPGTKGLTVETDASRNQGVLVTESGARVDIQALADDGSLVACVAAAAVSPIVDETSSKGFGGNRDAVVIGTRGDGGAGAWAYIGGKMEAMYDEVSGRQTSRLPDADDRNGTFHGSFGWTYHVQGVSEDGRLIAGYAENVKGFTAGGITVDPGTTIGVYWHVSKHPNRPAYITSRAHIIGTIDQAKVQAAPRRFQRSISALLQHSLGQLKLFLLGFYNQYFVMVDSNGVHLDTVNSVYKVTGTNQDEDPAIATITRNDVISIALLPPATPGGLAVGSATTSALTVSWTASSGAISYQVFRDTTAGGSYAAPAVYDGTSTSFTDSPLTAATTYYYKVQATNAGGSSALSAAVSGATLAASGGGGHAVTVAWDINGTTSSSPTNLVVYNGALYFFATDVTNGSQLRTFDGTSGTTIGPVAGLSPQYLTVFGSSLYMQGVPPGTLYSYNGSTLAAATPTVNRPRYLAAVGSTLYMSGWDSTNGQELWSYTGSTAAMVKDINTTALQSSNPAQLAVMGGILYFSATDGTGRQLWQSDGTSGGTTMVYNISGGVGDALPLAAPLVVMDNALLFFPATPDGLTYYLYSYGGSGNPTAVSTAITLQAGGFGAMIVYNHALYFRGTDGSNGYQLYKTDGISVTPVPAINTTGDSLASTVSFGVYNNELYFGATDGTTFNQLYKYDGSTVTLVKTINPAGDASPGQFAEFNGRLYFSATEGINGAQLWVLY